MPQLQTSSTSGVTVAHAPFSAPGWASREWSQQPRRLAPCSRFAGRCGRLAWVWLAGETTAPLRGQGTGQGGNAEGSRGSRPGPCGRWRNAAPGVREKGRVRSAARGRRWWWRVPSVGLSVWAGGGRALAGVGDRPGLSGGPSPPGSFACDAPRGPGPRPGCSSAGQALLAARGRRPGGAVSRSVGEMAELAAGLAAAVRGG